MKRVLYNKLIKWKQSPTRKPLLLQGARQVGKTWLIKEFAKREFKNNVYLNFEQDTELQSFFKENLQPEIIVHNLELYFETKIDKQDTLLIFDEIQTAPRVITSLKYFYEKTPEYHIIGAGSLLGVSIGKTISFPVGKVNFLTLYPMRFDEYLMAAGEENLTKELSNNFNKFPDALHQKLNNHLKQYLFLGGMPEVLNLFFSTKDYGESRKIQKEILQAYQRDFSKYSDNNQAVKTLEFWKSVPYQLAKENKKFKYSDIKKRARSAYYEQTLEWLRNAGLIYPAYQVTTPKLPLSGYSDRSKFKIYMLDTGLLGAYLDISPKTIIQPDQLFLEYNGAFIENYIATQFTASDEKELFYWKSKSDAEVDFIKHIDEFIIPVEVKSGNSGKIKSLRSYDNKYQPQLIIRTSPANVHLDNNFINIPLYYAFNMQKIIRNQLI